MLFSILQGGSIVDIIAELLLILPVAMLALSLHETAHGYVAYKCGDNTAYNLGRLTLNPFRHIDPVGFLCMVVFGFGWAKPVPINTRNFRNSKRGMVLSAAAGPAANLLLGVISALFLGFFTALYSYVLYKVGNGILLTALYWVVVICQLSAYMNFIFMAFNLIPVPPFDGSRIALAFLPPKTYFGIMKYERQIMFGLLIALMILSYGFHFSPFGWIADKLTDLIANPIGDLFWKFFYKILTK